MKKQALSMQKIFENHISNEGFVTRICKDLSKFNNKKQTTQFKKRSKKFE